MKRFAKLYPWLWGMFAAAAMFAAIELISYIRFENSDDILIVKSFMGLEGGIPANFNLELHTITAHFIGFLSRIIPGVAWFSLLELFCLWFSTSVVCKCAYELSPVGHKAAGALISLLFLLICAVFASARINFTTTAALIGAASVAQLCSFAVSEKHSAKSAALSVALLIGCYLMRMQTLPAILPFWLTVLVYSFIKNRSLPNLKRLTAAALASALLIGGLCAIRAAETSRPELRAAIDFHDSNLRALDYDKRILSEASEETLSSIGWSKSELELVKQWYFMDSNITADAFAALESAYPEPVSALERASNTFERISSFTASNRRYIAAFVLLTALCALLAIPKKGFIPGLLAAVMTLGAAFAMLFYLAYKGRLLGRAVDCALFPAFALVSVLLASSLAEMKGSLCSRPAAVYATCLIIAALGISAYHSADTVKLLKDRPDTVSAVREADLESFALENGDKLIIRSPELLRDTRVFPSVSGGMPTNIIIWGDWCSRTPSWYYQLESFGFDGMNFTAVDFLNDNLLFAHSEAAPPEELTAYISDGCGRNAEPYLFGTRGELYFFGFK